ncbi:MAG: FprA family A-type flavoprotein [Elusimicrobiota bacterium]
MNIKQLCPNVYSVGAIDWDRRLFDELIPLPEGTTYNAYLVKGTDKTVLIDTVDPVKADVLIANLNSLGVKTIDFVVSHHGEQDHSGLAGKVVELYPGAKVMTNQKCKDMLKDLLHIPDDKFVVINDKDTLDLGGKTLEFIFTPWVHWPETFVTYLREDKVLFTCDFFGSHYAGDPLMPVEGHKVYESAKRYYAEIMMPFRTNIVKNIEKVCAYDVKTIAPSHGPVHYDPSFIINAYKEWTSDKVKNTVVLPYVSMHGSTECMVNHLITELLARGVAVKPFNIPRTDIGELAKELVDAATVIVGTPTVLTGPHPAALYATALFNALRPKTRYISIIGSYGWGGKAVETLAGLIPNIKAELIPPVYIKGNPGVEDFEALTALAQTIAEKHKLL